MSDKVRILIAETEYSTKYVIQTKGLFGWRNGRGLVINPRRYIFDTWEEAVASLEDFDPDPTIIREEVISDEADDASNTD